MNERTKIKETLIKELWMKCYSYRREIPVQDGCGQDERREKGRIRINTLRQGSNGKKGFC